MLVESNAPHQQRSFVEKGTPYSEIPLSTGNFSKFARLIFLSDD
jgi:hypothetical protein